jgi:hypothetical protein
MVLGLASAVAAGEDATRAQAGARYSLATAASPILLAAACAVAGDAGKVAGRLDGSRDVYQQNKDPKYLAQMESNCNDIYGVYGQVSGGMFCGDEFARPGHTDPQQAIESRGYVR